MVDLSQEQIIKNWKDSEIVVSINTLTYNHEKYIAQCIEGVLSQKTNFAFELLIHDDASTDKTADIIREYEKKYPLIVKPIYQTENQWSKGIKNSVTYQYPRAKGKYIALCEGDDYWIDENKLQMQVDFLENNPEYGMCYTKAKQYNQSMQKFIKKSIGADFDGFEDLLKNGNRIPTLTTVYRKDLLEKYQKEIQPNNKGWLMGDYPMWLYFSHESKIKYFDKETAVYRVLEESASHSTDINKMIKFEESVYDIKRYFKNKYNLNFKLKINYEIVINVFFKKLLNNYNKKDAKAFRKICRNKICTIKYLILYISSLTKFSCKILIVLNKFKKFIEYTLLVSFIKIFDFNSLVFEFNKKKSKLNNTIYLPNQLINYDDYKIQNKKTILLVTHELSLTGAPIALFNFTNRLKLLGYLPVIISPIDGQLTELFLNNGIPIIIFPEIYTTNIINKIEPLFDLIIVNTIITYPIIKKLNNKSKPVIWWIHESSIVYSQITKLLLPRKLTKNIHIYSVGNHPKYVLHKVRSRYTINELLYFIPEPIEISNKLNMSDDSREFVKFAIIGTIAIHKGQDIVIEAIEKLPDEIRKKIVLYFVGNIFDKSIYAKIEELVSKYPSNIVNLGVLTQKEIRTLYQNIDCLICSSREDSMPIVVTEAMMYSNLIICSENAGSAALIKQYNSGFVFQNNNSLELSELLTFVVQNHAKLDEIRKNARRTYDEIFSQEAFDRKIQKIINDIL